MRQRSLVEIARSVQSRSLKPQQVLLESYHRFTETHDGLNALVQPYYEKAKEVCLNVDTQGPLAGVPASIKECFEVQGLQTTLGISSRCGQIDSQDAPIVKRLKACGVVPVGKSNIPQAMYLHEANNPVWGRTNHPENKERGPGGSSGGDAALVAAGVVPLGVGNDLAGSVRQPAHACGVSALLPTSGMLGNGGACNTMPNFSVVSSRTGLITSTIADLKHVASSLDFGISPEEQPFTARRIAVWEHAGIIEPSPAIKRAVREAAQAVQQAGHSVEYIDDTVFEEAAWIMFGLLSADGGRDIRHLFGSEKPLRGVAKLLRIASLPRWMRPGLAILMRLLGNRIDAAALAATGKRSRRGFEELLARRAMVVAHMKNTARKFDAIICPVSSLPALPHETAARLIAAASPCLLANLVDLAAGAVPVTRVTEDEQACRYFSFDRVLRTAMKADVGSAGLPVGVQVIGLNGEPPEQTVLDIMEVIESRSNFSRWARQ